MVDVSDSHRPDLRMRSGGNIFTSLRFPNPEPGSPDNSNFAVFPFPIQELLSPQYFPTSSNKDTQRL
jgi:hypothetical protein